ncbi:MAG: hypothetical protein ACM3Y9_00095 [Ignavibacteria bacterium]
MRNFNLAFAGLATAAGLVLAGCAAPPPEERVAVVTPPVVAVAPPGAQSQSFHTTIGMTPTDTQGVMHLQSFAGDVCVQDANGRPAVSHCVCQETNCNCQSTGASCTP